MTIDGILSAIDAEIEVLEQARRLLVATSSLRATDATKSASKRRKRKLSAEARKKMADAQRRRWAKRNRSNKSYSVGNPG